MEQLQRVEQHIQAGDLDALRHLIDELIQSTDFDMLYEAADILFAYGFMEEADRIYQTLLLHLPDESQLKIDRARTLIELGEEDEALLLLKEVTPNDEEYVQSLLVLADYYNMTGMAEAALSQIKEAYSIEPGEQVIRFAYAELLLDSGKYGEATRFYLELNDETDAIGDVSIVARLAETYSAGAAYEDAIPYYELLLEEKMLPDTMFGAAFAYYQSGQAARAVTLLDQLLEIDPDYFSAYMLAGQAKSRAGDDQAAYETFKDGIRRDEYDKALQLSAGKCALKLGRVKEAEDHLKEALVLDPEYIEALITLASLYNEAEQDSELIELLSDHVMDNDDVPLLDAFFAYAYERTEQYENAYASYSKAYSEMKEDHEFLDKYASFLIEEGRRSEASEVVKQLLTIYPEDQNWRAFLEMHTDEEV